jgi:hypothetical protein
VIFLVFMNDGQLFGSYLDRTRAHEAAENITGVVVELPITSDYRLFKEVP